MNQLLLTEGLSINYEYIKCSNPLAETILFVHGLGLDLTTWDEVVDLLKSDFHVLRYDIRGHGKSIEKRKEKFSWELLINDLGLLLNELSIQKFHLIGHSGGGYFGIELAMKTNYIQSLTLISTPIYFPKKVAEEELKSRQNRNKASKIEDIVSPIVSHICYISTDLQTTRLMNIYKQIAADVYMDYAHLIGNTITSFSLEEMKKLEVPKLLLAGEFDVLCPPQLLMISKNYLSNSRFFIVPNSSNAVMMDQPEEFVNYTKGFIKELKIKVKENRYVYTDRLSKELNSIVDIAIKSNSEQNTIRLNMINGFKLVINGDEIVGKWNQRKAKQILSYIIIHQSVTREQLYDTFWSNYDLNKAQNNLRVSLNHLKTIIEDCTGNTIEDYFLIDRENISLKCETRNDINDLFDKIKTIEQEADHETKLLTALSTFNDLPDTLCNGFYERWIMDIRGKIETSIITMCEALLKSTYIEKYQIELLKVLIKCNPTEDLYYEQLIDLLGKSGHMEDLDHYNRKWKTIENLY